MGGLSRRAGVLSPAGPSGPPIVMIDLLRVGGIANWMKVAGMAEAFNLPVVSHLLPEIHVHLVSSIPNGLT